MNPISRPFFSFACLVALLGGYSEASTRGTLAPPTKRIAVEITDGHDTDPRDHGRPVVLVAGALGVPAKVFREAFSHVRPAPAGERPDPEQVRANKDALMNVLEPYGVTNDRLDDVSNYYRYVRSRGELWPVKAAHIDALVRNGKVIRFEVIDGGSGYTTTPSISIPSIGAVKVKVGLKFGTEFDTNGSISAVSLAK